MNHWPVVSHHKENNSNCLFLMSLCNPCCPLGQDKEKRLVVWVVKHERDWVSPSAVLPCEGFSLRTILVLGQIG